MSINHFYTHLQKLYLIVTRFWTLYSGVFKLNDYMAYLYLNTISYVRILFYGHAKTPFNSHTLKSIIFKGDFFMRFYYGEQNPLRVLDEAEFWKHQEAEHTDLIPLVTPSLEPQYTQQLHQFGLNFRTTQAEVVKYVESVTRSKGAATPQLKAQILHIIKHCLDQSNSFISLMTEMLQNSPAVQSSQPSQTVIHHMVRESQYFVGIAQLIIS